MHIQEVLKASKTLLLKGEVFSGSGEGARFTELQWVRRQIAQKLGFTPYLGTLNIRLTEDKVKLKLLRRSKSVQISPANGFCGGRCFNAHLADNLKCAIVIPEVANYPEGILEVVAPINLREKYRLKDGDIVEVKIVL
jgi:riboflavin kinase